MKKIKQSLVVLENKVNEWMARGSLLLKGESGEGFVDTAIKILMAVVIGALVLAGLYALFNNTVLPTLSTRIQQFFNYAG